MIRKPSRATRDAHGGYHRKGGRRKAKKDGLKGARGNQKQNPFNRLDDSLMFSSISNPHSNLSAPTYNDNFLNSTMNLQEKAKNLKN
jgi:hypothetical protein